MSDLIVELTITLTGTSPLLMHNVQASDPLHPDHGYLAEISKKRAKTEADHIELSKREWECSIYRQNNYPVMPVDNIHSMIYSSAKKFKEGPAFIGGGCRVSNPDFQFEPHGTVTEMWDWSQDPENAVNFVDRRSVKVQQNRVIRTRCIFPAWSLSFKLISHANLADDNMLERWLELGGYTVGLCDYRPQKGGMFGTFTHEIDG